MRRIFLALFVLLCVGTWAHAQITSQPVTGSSISGSIACSNMPALAGAVTSSAGSCTTTAAATGLGSAKRITTNAQSFNSSTAAAVTFVTASGGSTLWDDTTYYNNANPTRLTAPATAKYLIIGEVCWASHADGANRDVFICLNGSCTTVISQTIVQAESTGAQVQCENTAGLASLSSGDFIELWAEQDSGGAVALSNVNGHSGQIQIERIE